MIGKGILKGIFVTLRHFFVTYIDDLKHKIKRTNKADLTKIKSSATSTGLFTIEYPEQQLIPPEEFRVIPFLIYENSEEGEKKYRCTACGICAKVCPTQCIWITRKKDAETGKPIAQSEEFYIDLDKCMNCGSCAEFCPFDAIKMDHDFEISTYERGETHIHSKDQLGKPLDYYAKIRPDNFRREEEARAIKAGVNKPEIGINEQS